MTAIDDLVSEFSDSESDTLRAVLNDIAMSVHTAPAPPPSAEVLRLIGGGVRQRTLHHRAIAIAGAGALAFGGTSVAAAQSGNLPPKVQNVVADFANEHLPVNV